MKQLNLADLKKLQLEILEVFHEFCIKKNLQYSLSFGTLLGCVRHCGYIPWDDDIDVMMPRKDYDHFIQDFSHEYYEVIDHNSCNGYWLPFAKIQDKRTIIYEFNNMPCILGINIDVFPIDNFPDNRLKYKTLCIKKGIFNALHTLKMVKINEKRSSLKNGILWFSEKLLRCLPMSYIISHLISISKSNNEHKTNFKGVIVPTDSTYKLKFPSHVFSNYTNGLFEGKNFKIIKEYDIFLSVIYSDYMKLPPVDKQCSHHIFKAFFK